MWRNVQRWRGIALIGLAVVATAWMAFGNQLVLYIHPRYIVFTVVMAVLALGFVVLSIVVRSRNDEDDEPQSRRSRVIASLALVVAGAMAVAMVVLPPATLSSATASQRDINSTTVGAETQSVEEAEDGDAALFASFTVVDWASLLRQTNSLTFYDVVGFITVDPDDPQNVFYVSRFTVTCCAVDAQPSGIPVYMPDWQNRFAADDWVQVTGEFTTNPSERSTQPLALDPDDITQVEQPSEPYLY
jgi:putative membrane protein